MRIKGTTAALSAALVLAACTLAGGAGAPASAAVSYDVRVGSFNLAGVNTDTKAAGDHKVWRERRPVVAHHIMARRLDVVGLQEANQSKTYASRLDYGDTQYRDLVGALNAKGGNYAVTNDHAYNCVNAASTYNCVPMDRDAAGDNRIIFDTDILEMVAQGAEQYQNQTAGKNLRYLVWAKFKVKATGKQFLFTTTHLDPYSDTTRKAQWSESIALTNQLKGSLPVVAVGDYNVSKFTDYAGQYMGAMKSNGYGDVLNQQAGVNTLSSPRAESVHRAWVGSFNGYRRDVKAYSYDDARHKIGNGIDWIFATNALRVKSWEVVVSMNTRTLQQSGVIPSDHHLVRATIDLR